MYYYWGGNLDDCYPILMEPMDQNAKAIGYLIDRTQKRLKLSLTHRLQAANIDLTVEQWVVLDCIHSQGKPTQNQIADLTFKDAPNISRILGHLVAKKLIVRETDEKDRRRTNISLNEKGVALFAQAFPVVQALREESWQHLNQKEYQTFVRILNQVFENLS
ncbi:MAG: MarR family winged helix-turn-helix transcriptional regulator [Bacteroidota bacterium]